MPQQAQEEFIYYLRREHTGDTIEFSLSHSGTEGGDAEMFAAISADILCAVFSDLWVSMWICDGEPRDYLFPDGHRCDPPEVFSRACSAYLRHTASEQKILCKHPEKTLVSSCGLCFSILEAYLSDVKADLYDREVFFWGFEESFEPEQDFDTEKRRMETRAWDVYAEFDELHDNLNIFVKAPCDVAALFRCVEEICGKYGKEFRIPDDQEYPT
ncbi:MAG: hypothetical protein IJA73_04820 [Oscillospiraceae bacterium]|nr:hypothetical protein [Oscillospiraceae bacterium]